MDQRLKERLIGAVVLVALAVWLIPWLLDGPERETGTDAVALNLPAAEEAAPRKAVTIDLNDRGRPEMPARNAAQAPAGDAAEAPTNDSPPPARPNPDSVASAESGTGTAAGPAEPGEVPDPETTASEPGGQAAQGGAAAEAASSPGAAASEGGDRDADSGAAEPAETATDTDAELAAAEPAAGDWAVQLGSFGEAGNAERLAARVAMFGYEPEVSTYRSGGRDLHRVRVGPQPSRARAEAVASALTAHGFVAQVVTAD